MASSYLISTEPPCLAELERIQVQGAAKMNPGKKKQKNTHKTTSKFRIDLIEESAVQLSTLTLIQCSLKILCHAMCTPLASGIHAGLT